MTLFGGGAAVGGAGVCDGATWLGRVVVFVASRVGHVAFDVGSLLCRFG